ncbi:P27 family phage terminase small subunit [Eubacterium callanderi]|uniref:P27 family phage terminase small subunit n=1 Tax=Eubacterium callanderi TaxID=53442 RepID=UPI0026727E7E|nr:P27 family phage terminase small subunit [Eubacterium callanderi]
MATKSRKDIIGYKQKSIKEQVVEDMEGLGVYKPEYDSMITIYAGLLEQYYQVSVAFEQGGRLYETTTAAGGTKKSALVSTLESLRKDIVTYSDRLCLNPKSVESVTTDIQKKSRLAALFDDD